MPNMILPGLAKKTTRIEGPHRVRRIYCGADQHIPASGGLLHFCRGLTVRVHRNHAK